MLQKVYLFFCFSIIVETVVKYSVVTAPIIKCHTPPPQSQLECVTLVKKYYCRNIRQVGTNTRQLVIETEIHSILTQGTKQIWSRQHLKILSFFFLFFRKKKT